MAVGAGLGQTANRQVDTAESLQHLLAAEMGLQPQALWTMRNGYLESTQEALGLIGCYLGKAEQAELDHLRAQLCI